MMFDQHVLLDEFWSDVKWRFVTRPRLLYSKYCTKNIGAFSRSSLPRKTLLHDVEQGGQAISTALTFTPENKDKVESTSSKSFYRLAKRV